MHIKAKHPPNARAVFKALKRASRKLGALSSDGTYMRGLIQRAALVEYGAADEYKRFLLNVGVLLEVLNSDGNIEEYEYCEDQAKSVLKALRECNVVPEPSKEQVARRAAEIRAKREALKTKASRDKTSQQASTLESANGDHNQPVGTADGEKKDMAKKKREHKYSFATRGTLPPEYEGIIKSMAAGPVLLGQKAEVLRALCVEGDDDADEFLDAYVRSGMVLKGPGDEPMYAFDDKRAISVVMGIGLEERLPDLDEDAAMARFRELSSEAEPVVPSVVARRSRSVPQGPGLREPPVPAPVRSATAVTAVGGVSAVSVAPVAQTVQAVVPRPEIPGVKSVPAKDLTFRQKRVAAMQARLLEIEQSAEGRKALAARLEALQVAHDHILVNEAEAKSTASTAEDLSSAASRKVKAAEEALAEARELLRASLGDLSDAHDEVGRIGLEVERSKVAIGLITGEIENLELSSELKAEKARLESALDPEMLNMVFGEE